MELLTEVIVVMMDAMMDVHVMALSAVPRLYCFSLYTTSTNEYQIKCTRTPRAVAPITLDRTTRGENIFQKEARIICPTDQSHPF